MILVVIFGGLFVAADRAAVYFAEGQVAEKLKSSQGLSSDPEVSIKGFPFLTQVFDSLEEVDIRLDGVNATVDGRAIQVTEVKAVLKDVTIDSGYTSATAGRAEGSARISYADLERSAPKGVSVGYAGDERAAKSQVKLSGSLADVAEGAGVNIPAPFKALLAGEQLSVYSTVSLSNGDTVRLKAASLPSLPIPGFESQLRDLVDYDMKIEGLPSTVKLDKVAAEKSGLRFTGTGTDVSLTG
ncbi:DUF2993 domain-containing protein [Streptomyces corynorhini]|uniref:DUF2993 domain-containing protein n=1 Tax=Streptomyces corynorhini TaxID=2282652 RepID=A0A370BC86_9ACTN|nr:DUF2993 domain-containing protein [Streptomyces corynorhini]